MDTKCNNQISSIGAQEIARHDVKHANYVENGEILRTMLTNRVDSVYIRFVVTVAAKAKLSTTAI